jgi:hypothetical protein
MLMVNTGINTRCIDIVVTTASLPGSRHIGGERRRHGTNGISAHQSSCPNKMKRSTTSLLIGEREEVVL